MNFVRRACRVLTSRLGWRLLAVFFAASLLPLGLSDWVATSVIGDLSRKLYQSRRAEITHDVSRQVFDRLMIAKTLLNVLFKSSEESIDAGESSQAATTSPFKSSSCQSADRIASDDQTRINSGAVADSHLGLPVVLGISGASRGSSGRLMMAETGPSRRRCVAEINPQWLWKAVRDASDESSWIVRADDGVTLIETHTVDDFPKNQPLEKFRAQLFLAGEFVATSWTFEQISAPAPITWHGRPIVAWLLSVAIATLLGIGLLGHWTLRRALTPLQQLTEGARRLAAGISPTRVDVRRHDELGKLASSFNDMASQLEARIQSMRSLARIDAGILSGEPLSSLARKVLEQLSQLQPGVMVAVMWRDAQGAFSRVSTDGDETVEALELDFKGIAQFDRLTDGAHDAAALVGLGFGRTLESVESVHLLTVRHDGCSQALITLALATDVKLQLAGSCELRDRLSVAIAARKSEFELQYRATHDALTGLKNLYGLQQSLDPALARAQPMAVFFLDLDHFKDINDCHGHAVGDRLLQLVAKRLQQLLPDGGVLSRNGGDEFVVAIPAAGSLSACELAVRFLEELGKPFVLSAVELACGVSIGIALSPQHGADRDELLRCADIALYESKTAGRNRYTLFAPEFDATLRERNDLLAGLARALSRAEFVVHYQPRVEPATRAITSAEALIRWQHPDRGLTAPGVFIALAESSGLIDALGSFVMEATIKQIAEWEVAGVGVDRISVNVSQRQFASCCLVGNVRELLERYQVLGNRLEIEVTESLLSGDMVSVRTQLHELRALGITIAMDDFGTGYSSMAQLRDLPIDVMKIDRTFVKDLETDASAVAIAQTIVTLARAMGLKIVAEGIETESQAATLGKMGCDEFQGFLFSRALPAREFSALASIGGRARFAKLSTR